MGLLDTKTKGWKNVDVLREEYRFFVRRSGISFKRFNALARADLNLRGIVNPTPEDWIVSAGEIMDGYDEWADEDLYDLPDGDSW
jgi:hypothetical protein